MSIAFSFFRSKLETKIFEIGVRIADHYNSTFRGAQYFTVFYIFKGLPRAPRTPPRLADQIMGLAELFLSPHFPGNL
jgi:hypothetical protein